MKKPSAKEQQRQQDWILAGCEEIRQRCNKLSKQERRRLRESALTIIYGHDATTARSR